MADQVLKRGVPKVADSLEEETNQQVRGMKNSNFQQEHRMILVCRTRGSREAPGKRKAKKPQHFGDLVKHSIRDISEEERSGGALQKTILQEYRRRITHVKTRNDSSIETQQGLLERHLFRRTFSYATLDEVVPWNHVGESI